MTMITDVHMHLTDEAFNEDRDEIATSLSKNGVKWAITSGYDTKSNYLSVILASWHYNIYATVGMHPETADEYDEAFEKDLREFCTNEKVVAIGEIGLDFHYDDNPPRDIQKDTFLKQLVLAHELMKPVVVHSRDAAEDTFEMLRDNLPERGAVLHSFSQSTEMAKRYMDMNVMFSISGVATFKNSAKVREMIEALPVERILIETDSPYMTPVPNRGKRNCPAYASLTARTVSEIKGMDYGEFCAQVISNGERFFKILQREPKKERFKFRFFS